MPLQIERGRWQVDEVLEIRPMEVVSIIGTSRMQRQDMYSCSGQCDTIESEPDKYSL